MALYGHTCINIESLKRWVNKLSVENIKNVDIGGNNIEIDELTKKLLEEILLMFSKCINRMNDGDDWREYEGILNAVFYNAFVRVDNCSIRIGDFYECLIEPSNIKTYKKIIEGFDYINTGEINVKDSNGTLVATIGQKSDLIWRVFHEYFVNENYDGSIDHVYSNHEKYLSLQLFDVENLTIEKIHSLVNEILLHVSMNYDMDFKIFEVNSLVKSEGEAKVYNLSYTPKGLEDIPMFYLTNANSTNDYRFKYLSYYQVMEYFFVRSQNYYMLDELKKFYEDKVDHNELRKILSKYKKVTNEKESLKLVLTRTIDLEKLKSWIGSNPEYEKFYCMSDGYKIDFAKADKNVISNIADRIYSYRCSIAHAKGDVDEYIAIPTISQDKIKNEIPLVRYLAYEVITKCSEV